MITDDPRFLEIPYKLFKTIFEADFPMYRCFLAIFDCLSNFTYLRVFGSMSNTKFAEP